MHVIGETKQENDSSSSILNELEGGNEASIKAREKEITIVKA